ncbi:hypothetical protein N431DRAFT_426415 [Stipitochalara longipes BDJ]|nr:hypothetical protein N431DRAFT_426415 [Stipitochalara longipes BDJ]
MPSDAPLSVRLVQTLGITASSLLAGQVSSFSFSTVPRLLESPTPLMLRQWVNMFHVGKSVGQPSSIVIALSYFYLAYASHSSSLSHFLGNTVAVSYTVAGLLSMSIAPYTLTVLMPTNLAILAREEEVSRAEKEGKSVEPKKGEESAQVLLKRWAVLNLGRMVLLLGSAVLGTWTTINN